MDRLSHNSDVEARDPDKLRDQTLGAGTSLAASFGAPIGAASGPAESSCPGGLVATQSPVRDQGPDASRERSRLGISETATEATTGGRVTPPAKSHLTSQRVCAPASTLECSSLPSSTCAPTLVATAASPPKTTNNEIAVVAYGVDAEVIAYQLDVHASARAELHAGISRAGQCGTTELRLGEVTFRMKRTRTLERVVFENADVRCVFDEQACGKWVLEIVVRATCLRTHSPTEVLQLTDRIAMAVGIVRARRLRRVDLYSDLVRSWLQHTDVNRIVCHARPDVFIPDAKDIDEAGCLLWRPQIREHHRRNLTVSGFSVGPGNPFMARIYDKTAELALPGRELKRELEFDIWRAAGWDGESPVTRVEFQIRGEALDELDMRDPSKLPGRLNSLWQTGVRWMRLVIPDSATRPSRRKLDPRWIAVSTIPFDHLAPPIKRRRVRGGATPEHAIGAVLSRLAGSHQLERLELISDDGEVMDSELAFANSMSDAQAKRYLLRYFRRIGATFSKDILDTYMRAHGPQGAVLRVIARNNAAVARFSSVDDFDNSNANQNKGESSDTTTTTP